MTLTEFLLARMASMTWYCRGCSTWTEGEQRPSTPATLAGTYCECGYAIRTTGDAV